MTNNKYKQAYIKSLKTRAWSGDLLRILFYMSAGIFIVSFKWYIGFPIGLILLLFGHLVEANMYKVNEEIESLN